MLKKLIQKYRFNKTSKNLLDNLIVQINSIKSTSSVIAISPDNTELSYLGIKQGTMSLFPNKYLALPHYYSHPKLTDKDLFLLGEYIGELNFKQVIFRGITKKHEALLKGIKNNNLNTIITYLHAGPPSEFLTKEKQDQLLFIQKSCSNKIIDIVGVNKKGLASTLGKLLNVNCFHYIMKSTNNISNNFIKNKNLNQPKIGVFGNNGFNKNTSTQLIAALGIENAEIHTLKKEYFQFFNQFNIIQHPAPIPHNEFMALLSNMTINYYLSFSETWGHVILESLSSGVPCLASNTSGIFDYDEKLKYFLEVVNYDDIEAIQKQTKIVLDNYEEIVSLGINYANKINHIAEEKIKTILMFNK